MKTPPADMLSAAKAVLPNAYAPYSHFYVAASIKTADNKIFAGCNVENAAYPLTLCAEANAIGSAVAQGYHAITEALVLVDDIQLCPPCGSCRQRLLECAQPDALIHLCTLQGEYAQYTVAELLPVAFGPKNLEKSS